MRTTTSILAAALAASLAACGGAQSSEPAAPPVATTTTTTTTTTAPAGDPPAQTQHAEAHLNQGHVTLEHQIQFDSNSDHIQEAASQGVLTDLIAVFRENTQIRRVRVEGHTDERGGHGTNQDLSQRRAAAVATYLGGHGLSNITFEPVGYGETQPLCREDTEECHNRNRRVEFTITEPAATAAPAAPSSGGAN